MVALPNYHQCIVSTRAHPSRISWLIKARLLYELKGQVQERFDFAVEMGAMGVKCPEHLSGENNQCDQGEKGASSSVDWIMAIAQKLAKVIQNQADKVKPWPDAVSDLSEIQFLQHQPHGVLKDGKHRCQSQGIKGTASLQ